MITLTSQELANLTGRAQPAAQIRWLNDRNWLFEIGFDGLPKVAAAYFERRLVHGVKVTQPDQEANEIDAWAVNTNALKQNSTN